MNPFTYLESDHKKIASLLTALEETTERAVKTREKVHEELEVALTAHAKIEEEILYPVLEELKKTHDITLEAVEEHHVIKTLLKELAQLPEKSEHWTAKLTVLKEMVEHHVKEEEGDMFPKARKALSEAQQEELGEQVQEMLA
jgi:hemerythrin superfamily protein